MADCQEVTDAVNATEMNLQPVNAPAPRRRSAATTKARSTCSSTTSRTPPAATGRTVQCPAQTVVLPAEPKPLRFDATYATSGKTNFWGDDQGAAAEYVIGRTADVAIPAGTAYLRFNHSYAFEDAPGNRRRYDGGQLR